MGMPATLEQTAFRGREDDDTEADATWIANTNVDWTQDVDVNFRVRFQITSDGEAEDNLEFALQHQLGVSGFANTTASSTVVRIFDSTHITDGVATTEQLAGANTFLAGEVDDVNGIAGDINNLIDFPAAVNDCEVEFCVQIRGVDVNDAEVINFRLVEAGAQLGGGYTEVPIITVNKPSAGGGHPAMRRWGGVPYMTPGPHSHSRSW